MSMSLGLGVFMLKLTAVTVLSQSTVDRYPKQTYVTGEAVNSAINGLEREDNVLKENIEELMSATNDLKRENQVLKEKIEELMSVKRSGEAANVAINELKRQDTVLMAKIEELMSDKRPATTGSSTYIRWGRTTCPVTSGAERVYKGYAAGSRNTETGGGSNYVCLTNSPQWKYTQGEFTRGKTGATANIWGSEYQTESGDWPLKRDNINGGTVLNNDVPCAVCDTKGQVLMIPGTFRCPYGWQQEYSGYLMAEWYGHSRSEFVCMDGYPEAVPGGSANTNGNLFYYAAGKCGTLPCPPYSHNREITCVVCSK